MRLVTATVHGRHPAGVIKFAAHGLHATLIGSHTHKAAIVLPSSVRRISASYRGDGYNKPSSARAKL